ncbi:MULTISPECIES: hypothetical protein [unclassified Mesorhizobium]|uniref:hypothetical protein n=1 Tax=unclassified Mesorhizobium TaxID=325217 RepID=UPI003337FF4A
MSDELNPRFREILAQADEINSQLEAVMPLVVKARRAYMKSRSDADRVEMERVEGVAQDLHRQFSSLGPALREASGLPDEVLEAITEDEEYPIVTSQTFGATVSGLKKPASPTGSKMTWRGHSRVSKAFFLYTGWQRTREHARANLTFCRSQKAFAGRASFRTSTVWLR